jgi:peptidoglycan/LPS O-acetylase OafA/YrhL
MFLHPTKEVEGNHRLEYLDGLRGLAILSVVLFHAYATNTLLDSYLDKYTILTPIKYGNLGVFLFFLISGFVILRTLERSENFFVFMKKRYLRLFPAMLCAVILIYVTAPYFFERVNGTPTLLDTIAPLTFIHPIFYKIVLGLNLSIFEGPFWSLYVEFIFYIVFGACFYLFGKYKAIAILALCSLITFFCRVAHYFGLDTQPIIHEAFSFFRITGIEHIGWFTAGALGYILSLSRTKMNLFLCVIAGIFASITYGNPVAVSAFIIFLLPFFSTIIQSWLANRVLLFFGFVSYPLYLIHDGALASLVSKLHLAQSFIPLFLLPVLPFGVLIIISYGIAKYLEPKIKVYMSRFFTYLNGEIGS